MLARCYIPVVLLIIINWSLYAQSASIHRDLKKIASEKREEFKIKKSEALSLANRLNLPLKVITEDSSVAELVRLHRGIPGYFITNNAGGAQMIKTSELYTGGGAGMDLSGNGITLGIWDQGRVRAEHQELVGRVTQIDGAMSNSHHATHVAGTLIASGVQANAKGMSYAASLHAHDWDFDTAEMAEAADNGLGVSQHSYGYVAGWHRGNWAGQGTAWHWFGDTTISGVEDYSFGFYEVTSQEWDELVYNAPYYLPVVSTGNDRGQGPSGPDYFHYYWNGSGWSPSTTIRNKDGGTSGYDCISHRAVAKNIISVGALTATGDMTHYSSWGPVDDGRVKPDIVAKGSGVYSCVATNDSAYAVYGGTSMSGPMVSGSIGILQEHQKNLHPGRRLLASTIKALIIHGANDTISGAPGPDYRYGWGLMNTRRSAEIMSANAINDGAIIMESSLFDGESIGFDLVATGSEPLRATLVWTDVPGTVPQAALNPPDLALVNDLDMRILDSNANTFYPYILNPTMPAQAATTGDNYRDNVEMIHIESPNAGQTFTINITHKGNLTTGEQSFSLIISGANVQDCPGLADAPPNVTIVNSECTNSCVAEGGSITVPQDACPMGSTLEFRVNDQPWTTVAPIYNQNGPSQTIKTRCRCDSFINFVSPTSNPVVTNPGVCGKVTNPADSGIGTLRHAVACINAGGTVFYDQPNTASTLLVNNLEINKSLTIEGLSSMDKPLITVDFSNISTAGIIISGNSTVNLKNIDISGVNNSGNMELIKVESPAVLILDGSVILTDQ